jgi:hypothetical protein
MTLTDKGKGERQWGIDSESLQSIKSPSTYRVLEKPNSLLEVKSGLDPHMINSMEDGL